MATSTPPTAAKYGITEKKKAELDALTIQVIEAQFNVDQYQAIVTSLTAKNTNLQGLLAAAESDRSQAFNNKNLIDQIVQNASDLKTNSGTAFTEITNANSKTNNLAQGVKAVMDKLIYTAEHIDKLSNIIIRKKALNPLISDDLVSRVSTAGKDANNAVALTLVALQSTFVALASTGETEATISLENEQSATLYKLLAGETTDALQNLLHSAYTKATIDYKLMDKANTLAIKDLSIAQANLDKAQVKLRSLQSGLAAANAAALAS